ncbi:MAG: hypothetical protein ACI4O7_02545 [Aristaeellaceae bacterium]
MMYTREDILRASLVGENVIVCYHDANGLCEKRFKLCGIDMKALKLKANLHGTEQPLSLECIESIRRIPVGMDEQDMPSVASIKSEIDSFVQKMESPLRDKKNSLALYRHFPQDLDDLRNALTAVPDAQELKDFFTSNSAMAGDIKRVPVESVAEQLERVSDMLTPRLAAFARSVLALACRNISDAQMAYLRYVTERRLTEAFVRDFGARLAITAMQPCIRKSQQGQQNPDNPCAFIFWMDRLMQVDPEQVLTDPVLWLNYLKWCVTYQHFSVLGDFLSQCGDQDMVYKALAYVFALHEQPLMAHEALLYLGNPHRGTHTPKELLVHLIDDELSYCVRFADRFERLVNEGKLGNPNVAYVYDYVRVRGYAHLVNGCMTSCFVNVKDIEQSIIDEMTEQLKESLDYEPILVSIRLKENVATSVEKW